MSDSPAISFVIPARNEAAAIVGVVEDCLALADVRAARAEVVVVDDASTDDTAGLVTSLPRRHHQIRLLRHSAQRGIAETTHHGLTDATCEVICYLDGDGQFAARDFAPMLEALDRADFIVGRRVRRAERGLRTWGSRAYNLATRLAGAPVHDVNCGFRVISRDAFRVVAPRLASRTSFYFAELTLQLIEAGYRVIEMPIGHRARQGGTPSGAGLGVVAGQFGDLARYAVRRPKVREGRS